MNLFTISDLQQYSGINVHSIRAWEKRYNALTPHRTKGNTRYYDGNQLKRLLNIVSLMNDNYKISELCSMSDDTLVKLLLNKLETEKTESYSDDFLVSQLVSSAINFDELLFDKIFSRAVAKYGLEDAYLVVIYPTIQRLGVLWSIDGVSVAQEHFATHLFRQKLITSIDILPLKDNKKGSWLLFLPEGELHEIGLLMANYLIRNSGEYSIYLGANSPIKTVKDTAEVVKPSFLLTFLVANNNPEYDQKFVTSISKLFPLQHIYICAEEGRIKNLKGTKNITFLTSMNDFKKQLT